MATNAAFEKGIAELKAGRIAEARRVFNEMEDKAGTSADSKKLLKQAEANLTAGKLDVAAKEFNTVLERNPTAPEVYTGLARISLFTSQLADAKVHATAAVKVGPQVALAWTLLGLVSEAEGDVKGALSNLEKGAQLGTTNFLCQYNLGRLLTATNRAAEAIPFLIRAIDLEPKNGEVFITLSSAQRKLKEFEKAIRSLETARDLNPKNLQAWANLGDTLFEAKQWQASRDILEKGLAAAGEHPALLEKAAAAAMMMSDAKGAMGYVERELTLVPNYERGWLNLAQLAATAGNGTRSEQAAQQLIKLNPKAWEAWLHLGNLYDAIPDEAKAEHAYRQALAIAPDEWKVLVNFGAALVQTTSGKKEKYLEGKKLLEKAIGLVPQGEWRAHYNLALAHVRLGENKQALALAREIIQKGAAADPIVGEAKKLETNLIEKN